MKRLLQRVPWRSIRSPIVSSLLVATIVTAVAAPARADDPATKGTLFFNGGTIRTVVVPAPLPNGGQDPFYKVTNGPGGQLGIAGVAPGSGDYHGGAWEVFLVTFKPGVLPYLLTSAQAVATAAANGDVAVVRAPALDFRCPVQP
jgi:hypothetical protein